MYPSRGQCSTLSGIGEIKSMITGLSSGFRTQPGGSEAESEVPALRVSKTTKRVLRYKPVSLEDDCASWGVRYSLIPTSQGPYRDYCIAMQISTPLARILGRFMLVMTVSVRTIPLCPLNLSLRNGSSLALARVLDNDHKFLVACNRGDLLAVRRMLKNGEGPPTDIGARNWTPLPVSQDHRTDGQKKC